jgi:hypothetical protein
MFIAPEKGALQMPSDASQSFTAGARSSHVRVARAPR